jgi:hypothetical protein
LTTPGQTVIRCSSGNSVIELGLFQHPNGLAAFFLNPLFQDLDDPLAQDCRLHHSAIK